MSREGSNLAACRQDMESDHVVVTAIPVWLNTLSAVLAEMISLGPVVLIFMVFTVLLANRPLWRVRSDRTLGAALTATEVDWLFTHSFDPLSIDVLKLNPRQFLIA